MQARLRARMIKDLIITNFRKQHTYCKNKVAMRKTSSPWQRFDLSRIKALFGIRGDYFPFFNFPVINEMDDQKRGATKKHPHLLKWSYFSSPSFRRERGILFLPGILRG